MKLTPLDIRKQEFSRRVRGVDEEEVKAFLQMLASQWEEIQEDQRRLEDKVRDLDNKLEHYKRVEEALQEALRTARENAKDALETARQKAQIIIQEAEATAVHVKRDADDERRKMRRQISRLNQRRDEIVSRLRAFLMSEMEMLARYEGDDAVGFIKLMPAQERPKAEVEQDTSVDEIDGPTDVQAIPELEAPAEPEPVEEPEAPLPPWAQFEEEEATPDAPVPQPEALHDVPEAAPVEPAEPELEHEMTEPVEVADVPAPAAQERIPEDLTEADFVEEAHTPVDSGSHESGDSPAFESMDHEVYSDGGSVDHDVPSAEGPTSTPSFQESPPEDSGKSKWLSEHLFSAFRRQGGADSGVESDETPAGIDDHGWGSEEPDPAPENVQDHAAPEEEEESFTVSSEEVERIRRILKGLD